MSSLYDIYEYGEQVSTVVKRKKQIAIGLLAGSLLTVSSVFAFRDSLPNWFKAIAFTAAIGSSTSAGIMAERDKRLSKMSKQFEDANAQKMAMGLNAAHDQNMKLLQAQGWIQTIDMVSRLPQTMQPGAINRWNLTDLIRTSTPVEHFDNTPGSLTIPANLLGQATFEESIAESSAFYLNIDWFEGWARRCGIVCGESGDGKSFLLTHIVLRDFIQNHGDDGTVIICDTDYGSSHDDSPPNTWQDLELGRHIFYKAQDCYSMILKTQKTLDDRAEQTAIATAKREAKPYFSPLLLIIDEWPSLYSKWTEAHQKDAIVAIKEILRRGLKQNVTCKVGTQSLAVGSTGINKDIIQQLEIVILYRSAQMEDNFKNIGLQPGQAGQLVAEVSLLPKQIADKFVCVTFINKKLSIQGIPFCIPAVIHHEGDEVQSVEAPAAQTEGDYIAHLSAFWLANDGADDLDRLVASEFTRITGRSINSDQYDALLEIIQNWRNSK